MGSLHLSHTNRSETSDQRPFGSSFWHNGARTTYFAKRAEDSPLVDTIHVAFYNRKANLSRLQRPFGYQVCFEGERTTFKSYDVANSPDLAAKLTLKQQMESLLKSGPKSVDAIALEMNAKKESVQRTLNRHCPTFLKRENGLIELIERTL